MYPEQITKAYMEEPVTSGNIGYPSQPVTQAQPAYAQPQFYGQPQQVQQQPYSAYDRNQQMGSMTAQFGNLSLTGGVPAVGRTCIMIILG